MHKLMHTKKLSISGHSIIHKHLRHLHNLREINIFLKIFFLDTASIEFLNNINFSQFIKN